MLGRLLLLFLITPALELGLLIQVDKLIGFWPTIGIIIATGVLGSYLAKREGTATWKRLNQKLSEGGLPSKELLDGVIILVAGALLVTPGVLTDVFGFMGLLPPTRALIRKVVTKRVRRKMNQGSMSVEFGFFGDYSGGANGYDDPYGPPARSSERDRDEDPRWEGRRRDAPRHVEEATKPGSGGEERDAV